MTADRRWLELRVRSADHTVRDLLPEALVALGARGVVEDADRFVAWFEEPDDADAFARDAGQRLADETGTSDLEVDWRWQEHEAWAESWKRGLRPRRIGERLVVHPSWKPPRDRRPDDLVIVLDPGMAFGTAEHGTTRGCMRLMEHAVTAGDRVLDVGAGSGILSIAAARLGASKVVAVEGDRLACEALRENLDRNRADRHVRVVETWCDAEALAAMGPFDGVVANIETGLLRPLIPGLAAAVDHDGWLIVSGILEDEWSAVAADLVDRGFDPPEVDEDGEWRSGRFDAAG